MQVLSRMQPRVSTGMRGARVQRTPGYEGHRCATNDAPFNHPGYNIYGCILSTPLKRGKMSGIYFFRCVMVLIPVFITAFITEFYGILRVQFHKLMSFSGLNDYRSWKILEKPTKKKHTLMVLGFPASSPRCKLKERERIDPMPPTIDSFHK